MINQQLLLSLPLKTSFDVGNFYVETSNRDAFTWMKSWMQWPMPGLVIYGPSGCGKTHLGFAFQQESKGIRLRPEDLIGTPQHLVDKGVPLWIDSLDSFLFLGRDVQLFLLQLYNLLAERKGRLLLLSKSPPARWEGLLPDLSSRLRALPAIEIEAPNDELLMRLLKKLFTDLQLVPSEEVFVYLVRHMERSFLSAQRVVLALNEASLRDKRPITVDLCRRVLTA
ncbi:MAG: hypothetical protein K2P90_02000 [Holosporales bacterium]|nr:hypothetical protein [Holosporales bacterium]